MKGQYSEKKKVIFNNMINKLKKINSYAPLLASQYVSDKYQEPIQS